MSNTPERDPEKIVDDLNSIALSPLGEPGVVRMDQLYGGKEAWTMLTRRPKGYTIALFPPGKLGTQYHLEIDENGKIISFTTSMRSEEQGWSEVKDVTDIDPNAVLDQFLASFQQRNQKGKDLWDEEGDDENA